MHKYGCITLAGTDNELNRIECIVIVIIIQSADSYDVNDNGYDDGDSSNDGVTLAILSPLAIKMYEMIKRKLSKS